MWRQRLEARFNFSRGATAREFKAKILTGDEHFRDLVGEAIMIK
jgi:hypothetical protein